MPGPGFKSLSPSEHRAISSKGGKVSNSQRQMRWRRKVGGRINFKLLPAEELRRIAIRGGKMSALVQRVNRLEQRLREIEET